MRNVGVMTRPHHQDSSTCESYLSVCRGRAKAGEQRFFAKNLAFHRYLRGTCSARLLRRAHQLGLLPKNAGCRFARQRRHHCRPDQETSHATRCPRGYFFDGYSRTILRGEAKQDAGVALNYGLEIAAPDSATVDRMRGRLVHLASGRAHHITHNPPNVAGKDDATGEDLIQRDLLSSTA